MARAFAGSFAKRVSNQIWAVKYRNPSPFSRSVAARYSSSYDKNVEELERPVVVVDHTIDSNPENKYWGPNPRTGVFGPADGDSVFGREPVGPVEVDGPGPTVLDQTAWFRPQEDVEKPPPV